MVNPVAFNELEEMTVSPAARLLGVSEAMVRVLADSGELPCRRVDRLRLFTRQDVLQLLARRSGE